jgi:hypothetical protein
LRERQPLAQRQLQRGPFNFRNFSHAHKLRRQDYPFKPHDRRTANLGCPATIHFQTPSLDA